jgi:L-lactate utilization protein LutB
MENTNYSSHFKLLDDRIRLNLASSIRAYRERFRNLLSMQDIEEIKEKGAKIRDENLKKASRLWKAAKLSFEKSGIEIHFAYDNQEAVRILRRLLDGKRNIVKSKSNLLEELDVVHALDTVIVETDIGDWLVHQMGAIRIHPNAPAMALSIEEISAFFKENYGLRIDESPEAITEKICKIIREQILSAEVSLTGVNFVTSEGHLVIVENEGNISLATRLPRTHMAVVPYHKIVETLEEAVYLSKCLSIFGTGKPSTAYINVISAPSYTTDIEKKVVRGAQGAQEVHVVVVDNNRSNLLADDRLRQALRCIGCGACMLYCPISELAGPNFGGKYQGGIGLVFSHFVCQQRIDVDHGIFACLGCELCEEVCPVNVKIWDNIKDVRNATQPEIGQRVIEEVLSKGSYSYSEFE